MVRREEIKEIILVANTQGHACARSWNSNSNAERCGLSDFAGQKTAIETAHVTYPQSHTPDLEVILGACRTRNLNFCWALSVLICFISACLCGFT